MLLRLWYLTFSPINLSPDEAHYWDWSRQLQWSYYSKPPMVAWLIALSTSIFGHTLIGVRFFALLGQVVIGLCALDLARRWKGAGAGFLALALVHISPEFAAGGLLMTPDIPTTTFWALALVVLSRIKWEANAPQWKYFIGAGLLLGLAGLSKYSAVFFYILLGLFMLFTLAARRWFLKPQVYAMGLLSALMTLPVFYWNWQHEWIGFLHVMGQAGGSGRFDWLGSLENFFGGQLAVVGPVTFLVMLYWWFFPKKREGLERFVWAFSAPLFAFFIYKAFGAKVQANWPVLAVFGGFVGVAGYMVDARKWLKVTFVLGLVLSGFISLVAHDTNMLRAMGIDLPIKRDPTKPTLGWQGLGEQLSPLVNDNTIILTTRYQTTGPLGFYTKGTPNVLYVNPGYRRQNQYDLWSWPDLGGKEVLYVNESKTLEPIVAKGFDQCRYIQKLTATRGPLVLRTAHVYHCTGYKGITRPRPENY